MLNRRRWLGYAGLVVVLPWAVWLVLGLFGWAPSMVAVFGIPGLRIPASIAIAGLLIAAIGFWQD
ncbi:hypothetical protein [Microbulbifer hydrolyticus]|uniref:Uncharacterized protein n=1 Tax=Microbulbifer hydrolyticus TaxID=48074 RepID=A0A6P1TCW6_9GAMM|nr:hypothetical protein [Microbulbifer hydrolyticus]MBB5211811.1 hypothetical protein [Microbulbifer hydrolyticus]QHQ40598.1 hypothetical protein GTQ55_17505 [Microbulbifer hydrolyticus]